MSRQLTLTLHAALALSASSTVVRIEPPGRALAEPRLFAARESLVQGQSELEQGLAPSAVPAFPEGYDGFGAFSAGIAFGVLTCGIVFAFLVGCQVISIHPSGAPAESCRAPMRQDSSDAQESLHLFWPRCRWLAAMMILQSVASFILAQFQHLVESHADLIFFLTMLVGLGGNTGGQSVVLTCRKLALGEDVSVRSQLMTGVFLGLSLAPLAFLRAVVVRSEAGVCFTLAGATFLIASVAAGTGTVLPKMLLKLNADPGQASSMIQVIMDILGIMITCLLGAAILR